MAHNPGHSTSRGVPANETPLRVEAPAARHTRGRVRSRRARGATLRFTPQASGVTSPAAGCERAERARRLGERGRRDGAADHRRRSQLAAASRNRRRGARLSGRRRVRRDASPTCSASAPGRRRASSRPGTGARAGTSSSGTATRRRSSTRWRSGTSATVIAVSDSVEGRFVILPTQDAGRALDACSRRGLARALPNEGAFAASGTNVAVLGPDLAWFATTAGRVLRTRRPRPHLERGDDTAPRGPDAPGSSRSRSATPRTGWWSGATTRRKAEANDNAALSDDGGVSWKRAVGLSGFRSVVAHRPGLGRTPSGSRSDPQEATSRATTAAAGRRSRLPAATRSASAATGRRATASGEEGRIARLDLGPSARLARPSGGRVDRAAAAGGRHEQIA